MFKFLSNENKGESYCGLVQNKCYELMRNIVRSEHHLTTIYPHSYEFENEEYFVQSLSYWFDVISQQVIYRAEVINGNYIVNVEFKRGLHENI